MLKKTITYNDLDGNPVTEDFYFNLNEVDLAKLEVSQKGGLSAWVEEIAKEAETNGTQILETFEKIIRLSVGRKHEDNRQFERNEQITKAFMQSNAYVVLFMEMMTNAKASAEFIRAIVPASITDSDLKKAGVIEDVALPEGTHAAAEETEIPAYIREDREPTQKELMEMSQEQLIEAMKRRSDRINAPKEEPSES
jgi:hypothetical protein